MTIHIVLDVETMGLASDSAVMSIGAVSLGGAQFEVVVSNPSGSVNAETARWWMMQAPEVRSGVQGGIPEPDALAAFAQWLAELREAREPEDLRLWGSEDFDTVILANAYARCGLKRPWHYREPRGLRTILELANVDEDAMPWTGVEHVAIECARHAASALAKALAI